MVRYPSEGFVSASADSYSESPKLLHLQLIIGNHVEILYDNCVISLSLQIEFSSTNRYLMVLSLINEWTKDPSVEVYIPTGGFQRYTGNTYILPLPVTVSLAPCTCLVYLSNASFVIRFPDLTIATPPRRGTARIPSFLR